ncbi:hypothetical protein K438DRAFT_1942058 [Mycena galopus ATCC 62051]|nr:hypothetical protein K438DRAFT_1942058 [Mycena galopus ATCC 62051]
MSSASAQMEYYPPPAGSPPQVSTPPSGVHLTRDADYLIESFLPASASPPPYEISKLLCRIALPTDAGFDAPFCRAYNPTLQSVDITQEQLLSFIDGLNLAMTASPPLRVVNIVGMAIGFVGAAIQVGAKTGMRVLSKTLTDRYLRTANLRLFKPRGLSLTRFGRGVGSVAMKLPIPLASMIVHAVADKPPQVRAMNPGQAAKAQGVMDTMGSWGVKFDSWRDGRTQKKAEDLRLQLEREQRGGSYQSSGGGGAGLGGLRGRLVGGGGGRFGARDDRYEDRGAGAQPGGRLNGGGGVDRRHGSTELQVANADLVEHWQSSNLILDRLLFSSDDEIELIEMAESQNDEEQVDERAWQQEMTVEREEIEFDAEVQRVAEEEASHAQKP